MREVVDRALVAAGLKERAGKRVSTHTLRHSFATNALLAGADRRHLQAQGGWRDPKMVDVYGHVVERVTHNPSELLAL
jgi:site-specific recombinase XerD